MSEIKLFRLSGNSASEIPGTSHRLERSLQTIVERNLEVFLGVRFLATEHSTGVIHGGRVDSLGIDENGNPVILEYKRVVSENVVSQGLYYLDWLLDHKAEFELLVIRTLGQDAADGIDWSAPRLVCIAADFTKFDEHAIRQINRNIDLVRYKRFGDDLLALELATSVSSSSDATPELAPPSMTGDSMAAAPRRSTDKPVTQAIEEMTSAQRDLWEALRSHTLALGDDVTEKWLKLYIAFRRIKNFATVVVQKKNIQVYIHIDPDTVEIDENCMRDVREIGHWGTGQLEVAVVDDRSLQLALPLIERAYEG